MKGNYYTETFDTHHIHFGGRIYPSDFHTSYSGKKNAHGSPIAARIASDLQWEKTLQNNNRKEKTN